MSADASPLGPTLYVSKAFTDGMAHRFPLPDPTAKIHQVRSCSIIDPATSAFKKPRIIPGVDLFLSGDKGFPEKLDEIPDSQSIGYRFPLNTQKITLVALFAISDQKQERCTIQRLDLDVPTPLTKNHSIEISFPIAPANATEIFGGMPQSQVTVIGRKTTRQRIFWKKPEDPSIFPANLFSHSLDPSKANYIIGILKAQNDSSLTTQGDQAQAPRTAQKKRAARSIRGASAAPPPAPTPAAPPPRNPAPFIRQVVASKKLPNAPVVHQNTSGPAAAPPPTDELPPPALMRPHELVIVQIPPEEFAAEAFASTQADTASIAFQAATDLAIQHCIRNSIGSFHGQAYYELFREGADLERVYTEIGVPFHLLRNPQTGVWQILHAAFSKRIEVVEELVNPVVNLDEEAD